jgi:hypothetical protein
MAVPLRYDALDAGYTAVAVTVQSQLSRCLKHACSSYVPLLYLAPNPPMCPLPFMLARQTLAHSLSRPPPKVSALIDTSMAGDPLCPNTLTMTGTTTPGKM